MQQDNNKNLKIIFWALTIICMALIFYFSSRTAEESSNQSGAVLEFLINILGDNSVTDFIVRKSAHCLEYTGLCLLFNCAFYFTRNKKSIILSIICTSAYAVTDEIHQLFVDGRSCEVRDWAIDTGGAVLGAIGFLILFSIINAIIKSRKSN
ncbi:MAG: VanZ family protein [Eubacterium sp.]